MIQRLIHKVEKRLLPQRSERWRSWTRHDPSSTRSIDHGPWDDILSRFLVLPEDGDTRYPPRMAYGRFSDLDRQRLRNYVHGFERLAVDTLNRDEQFAFWCNLYNATIVHTVLEHYPIRKLHDIGVIPVALGGGPWAKKRVTVQGWHLSLDDIEHRILRRGWRDRRVHYALNCGALGCPDLFPHAFRAETVMRDLDGAERRYINAPRGVRFDGARLVVSSLFIWYKRDFVAPDDTLTGYLGRHAEPELAARIAAAGKVDDHEYDWTLNDAG